MNFRISKIILWPKNESLKIREIKFETDKVNVITGDSERGKSALKPGLVLKPESEFGSKPKLDN